MRLLGVALFFTCFGVFMCLVYRYSDTLWLDCQGGKRPSWTGFGCEAGLGGLWRWGGWFD